MKAKKVKRKFWLGLLMSPLTLIPFVGGGTLFLVFGALGKLAQAGFVLLGGFGLGIGGLFTNATLRGDKFLKKAKDEAADEEKRSREFALDNLERELELDNDSRTDGALRDLRALAEAFKREFDWSSTSKVAASELLAIVNKSFVQCVKTLRATLRLYKTINSSNMSKSLEKSLKTKRDAMVQRVQQGVLYLTSLFEQMQELSTADDPSAELFTLSKDLSRKLDVLKRIDARTRKLDKQIRVGEVSGTSSPEEDFFGDLE